MTKKRLFFIGIAGLILVFLWPLLNNFIPLIKEWTNAKHDQAFLREVFKQANFQNALILLSLMILSSAIPGVSSSIFCIFCWATLWPFACDSDEYYWEYFWEFD